MTTWILVADAARARIFQKGGPGEKIAEVRSLIHPASRQKTSELVSDRAGRLGKGGIGGARRSAMEADTSPHEAEANQFAGILAEALEQGIDRNEYARLVMVAPPHFLGTLRSAISGRVGKAVTETVNQDYTHLNDKDLAVALDRHLSASAYA